MNCDNCDVGHTGCYFPGNCEKELTVKGNAALKPGLESKPTCSGFNGKNCAHGFPMNAGCYVGEGQIEGARYQVRTPKCCDEEFVPPNCLKDYQTDADYCPFMTIGWEVPGCKLEGECEHKES